LSKSETNLHRFELLETEQRNLKTLTLSALPTETILRLINNEDRKVPEAVGKEIPAIAKAIHQIVESLRDGGRLIYVGAGTSGRLGILDVAELIPTFNAGPELVQAIIAGGKRAVFKPVEGAEDNERAAIAELRRIRLSRKDVVLGISASGRTPFVLGALKYARRLKARAIAITVNPASAVYRHAQIVICPRTGREVLAGSTRMKAGTAQKLVLNMISTVSMIRLGRVHGNLTIGLKPASMKLIERAKRIVAMETGLTYDEAAKKLQNAKMNVGVAILMAKANLDYRTAQRFMNKAHGSLEKALNLANV
jgi:N-acetylmuramic acid 6-phosphate etherase